MKASFIRVAALAAFALIASSPAFAWNSAKVQFDLSGRLVYPADANGNRIPDYSHAGYKGGGVPLPAAVPVQVTISPIDGDDTANIQAALDSVGALPLQPDGYRGSVLLTPGVYDVEGTIRIRQSGVVLSGSGDGDDPATNTILRRAGTSLTTVIQAGGGGDDQFRTEVAGTRRPITTPRVNVGSRVFNVDDASPFAVGDNIVIHHPSTAAWITAMELGGVTDANIWGAGQIDIRYHRYITAISGNTISIDAPVYNHLERSLAQSSIYKYNHDGVLTHLGIEDLQVDIVTAGESSEDHAKDAIEFNEAEDSWIRDCTAKHFVHAGVQFAGSTRCTAERVRAIEPHSLITGERRYNFAMYHAQLILFRDCFASYARHAFVMNGTSTDSGNVVLNSIIDHNYTYAEAHRRWSTGLLFDGIVAQNRNSNDVLGFYNRGNYGTGHGWAAGHSVLWRCDAAGGKVLVQRPPTAQNYAIGCFGNITGSGPWAGPVGYIEGSNTADLQPQSLYLEQLAQRQNNVAPPDLTPPSAPVLSSPGNTANAIALSWTASGDNLGVDGYDVFANSNFVGATNSATRSFTVTGLAPATDYALTVHARDVAGNLSDASNAVLFTTSGTPVPSPILFESEFLARTTSGANASIATETNASGGAFASNFQYVSFSGDLDPPPPGEYIDFILPNIPAGTYNLFMRYKTHPANRGILRLSVDGVDQGPDLNQRSSPATYRETDFGVVRFATPGDHVVRLTLLGRDATAAAYTITSDTFTLKPDIAGPVVTPPSDITLEATGPDGAVATYTGTATDDKDGALPVTFTPPSGSTFPLGTSVVVGTAQDFSGNIGVASFQVIVNDTTPPTLTLPADLVAEATGPDGAPVNFSATATDLVSGDVGIGFSQSPGTTFALGTTTVTATAEDDAGNSTSGSFTVTVVDTIAPKIRRLRASPRSLWPPNNKLVPVTLTALVSDVADASPRTHIISVSSSGGSNGNHHGNKEPDWIITGDMTLKLRAERGHRWQDRVYTIVVESVDASGNASTASVKVRVDREPGRHGDHHDHGDNHHDGGSQHHNWWQWWR